MILFVKNQSINVTLRNVCKVGFKHHLLLFFQANVTVKTSRTRWFHVIHGKGWQVFETRCLCRRKPTVFDVGKFQMARKESYRSVRNRKTSSTFNIKYPKYDPIACCFYNTFELLMYKRNQARRFRYSSCSHGHHEKLRAFLKFLKTSSIYGEDCRLLQFYLRMAPLNWLHASLLFHLSRDRLREKHF